MKIFSLIGATIVAALVIMVMAGSFYTVDEGERAVVVSQGRVASVATPGFHWKMPFIEEAHIISVRTQALEFPEEPVYTADRQTATVTFSVNYSAVPADKEVTSLYREYQTLDGMESRTLKRQIREQIKSVFGTFTADTAIRERGRLNAEIANAIGKLGDGLVKMEGVNIENINFSDAVERAAEDRARAEMLVNTKEQERRLAEKEAAISVIQAQAKADSQLAEARASSEAVRLQGEAEASAIKAKSEALASSPNLVELTKAERWDGKLPQTFVPGSAVPFINIK